jgi:translin
MAKPKVSADLKLGKVIRRLEEQEKAHDIILSSSRPLVRNCASAIKLLHSGELEEAKKEIAALDKGLKSLPNSDSRWNYLLTPIMQEMVEAKLLLSSIERKRLPTYEELGVSAPDYLLGVCDAIGEFRRQMLEELKRGRRKDAEYYFDLMQAVYDQLHAIRFSNSLLPNFKKKQDVARHQVEQARSELLLSR